MARKYVVYYQRYPEDSVSERSFDSKAEALAFWERKNSDYSYTFGRCWMETFIGKLLKKVRGQ